MPDIAMCAQQDCADAPFCRRSPQSGTVANGVWQSWLADDPRLHAETHNLGVACYLWWDALDTPEASL